MDAVRTELLQQLQELQGAPSVQMQQVPPEFEMVPSAENEENGRGDGDEDEDDNPDVRPTNRTKSGDGTRKEHPAEFYDQVD